MRTLSAAGIAHLKKWEGLRLESYADPISKGEPWTIGYGHTGPDVKPGMLITLAEAEALLKSDLIKFCKFVNKCIPGLNDNQFAACVSLTYNIGPSNFLSSDVLKHCKAKDFVKAADSFKNWRKAFGKIVPGLVARRASERELFLSPA